MDINDWLDRTIFRYLEYYDSRIANERLFYQGITVQKNPFDMWIYQEIIWELKPDIIVDIGCGTGGTALCLAHQLDRYNKGAIISIDDDTVRFRVSHPRISFIGAKTSDPQTVEKVKSIIKPHHVVMIIHDAEHHCNEVIKDLNNYWQFVSVGSYLIVEDGIIDVMKYGFGAQFRPGGPGMAIEEFLKTNDNFIVDKEREKFIFTYNPNGFLKRVK